MVGRRRSEIMVLSEVAVARTANNAQVRLIYRELGFSPQSFPPISSPIYNPAQVSDKQLTFSPRRVNRRVSNFIEISPKNFRFVRNNFSKIIFKKVLEFLRFLETKRCSTLSIPLRRGRISLR